MPTSIRHIRPLREPFVTGEPDLVIPAALRHTARWVAVRRSPLRAEAPTPRDVQPSCPYPENPVRRTLLVLALAALGAIAPAGLAGAAPLGGLLDIAPTTQSADDDPYLCIRSHVLLGEDHPICIHLIPADALAG